MNYPINVDEELEWRPSDLKNVPLLTKALKKFTKLITTFCKAQPNEKWVKLLDKAMQA